MQSNAVGTRNLFRPATDGSAVRRSSRHQTAHVGRRNEFGVPASNLNPPVEAEIRRAAEAHVAENTIHLIEAHFQIIAALHAHFHW